MEVEENQTIDYIFGQTPAFALNDSLVNPEAVRYLTDVRQEALRTNAIRIQRTKRHTADLYDDEEYCAKNLKNARRPPMQLKALRNNIETLVEWFKKAKHAVLKNYQMYQGHNEDTINLLLHYLKQYLLKSEEKRGVVTHLLNVLQNHPAVEDDDSLEIDEKWAESLVKKLKTKHIREIDDIKECISESNETIPMGFKEWYQYLQEREPTQSVFTSTINAKNIWVLIQYMTQNWVKDIAKCKKPPQATRFSNWLLYILFNLPINLTAEYASILRDLGKRCQQIINDDLLLSEEDRSEKKKILLIDTLPSELINLQVIPPPKEIDVLELTLSVVAIVYGQKDLTNFEKQPR